MRHVENYGEYYWCIKTSLSENGEIYLHADSVRITQSGDLQLTQNKDDVPVIMLAIAAGKWDCIYAASVFDGHAVAVAHWAGEIVEGA